MKTKPASMLWELIGRLASTTLTIRISGEMGVGKEAIARLLYHHYPHDTAHFLKIDCRQLKIAATPSPMADLNRMLTAPQRHILYLENVESTPKEIQIRLLEFLNTEYPSAPPWVIVSSLRPLERFLKNAQFSIPLFRALDTVHISLPPMRSRPEKIPQILSWFLQHYKKDKPATSLFMPGMDEMERLIDYHWPRNWRQLQEVAQQAFENRDWDSALARSKSNGGRSKEIDEIAAIYILSLARLSIQKDKVMEGLMAATDLDEIGLLDLAILNEAAAQIADHIAARDNLEEDF